MHYKNGQPATDGDSVIWKDYLGRVQAGTLHSTNPGCTSCNGQVAVAVPGGMNQICVTVGELYPAATAYNLMDSVLANSAAAIKANIEATPVAPSLV